MRSKWRGLAPTSDLYGFKLLLPGQLSICGEGCVFTVKFQLAASAHPILSFAHALLRAVEQVDLVQSGTFAQLHYLDTEVPHGLGSAGVLHALMPVAGLLHIGLAFHFSCSDAADHDVDVDVSRMVVPIRVSADDGGMTGEVFFAEFQAKCLCLFHGQPVVGCISWVKADDILVAFDITMLGVLAILAVCQQTGCCKREIAALKGVEQVRIPQLRLSLFIQKWLPGERIMLVNEVRFDGGVVRVFRAYMLERCHTVHPELSRRAAKCGQVCKFVKEFRPDLLGVCTAGIEVPCKLVEVAAHLAALGKQGGNSGQGFFSAACNDDRFLDLDVVDGTADKSGEGEIQEFASEFQ